MLRRMRALNLRYGCRVVVGFSGGRDSLALLGVLRAIGPLAGLEPVAVHVDHGLRPESATEQADVARLAAAIGVTFHAVRIEAEALVQHKGVGIEEAARRERYRLLAELARAEGTHLVALAHHQSDQAETVLLHILRGAGLTGAAAMAEVSHRQIPWWNDDPAGAGIDTLVWRPLLDEPRSVLATYVDELGLTPLDDPSNLDCSFRRNAIRHRVLPLLEEIQPGATEALARHAALIAADDEALADLTLSTLEADPRWRERLCRDLIVGQPLGVQRRMLRAWLTVALPGIEIKAERIDAARMLALSGEGKKLIEIGAGFGVTVRRGALRIVLLAGHDQGDETARPA